MRKVLAATSIFVTATILNSAMCPSVMARVSARPSAAVKMRGAKNIDRPAEQALSKQAKAQTMKALPSMVSLDNTKYPQAKNQAAPAPTPADTSPSQWTAPRVSSLYDQSRYDDCAFWVGDDSGLSLGSDDLSVSIQQEAVQVISSERNKDSVSDDITDNTRLIGACFVAAGVF